MRAIPTTTGGTVPLPAGITLINAFAALLAAGYGVRQVRGRLVAYRLH